MKTTRKPKVYNHPTLSESTEENVGVSGSGDTGIVETINIRSHVFDEIQKKSKTQCKSTGISDFINLEKERQECVSTTR